MGIRKLEDTRAGLIFEAGKKAQRGLRSSAGFQLELYSSHQNLILHRHYYSPRTTSPVLKFCGKKCILNPDPMHVKSLHTFLAHAQISTMLDFPINSRSTEFPRILTTHITLGANLSISLKFIDPIAYEVTYVIRPDVSLENVLRSSLKHTCTGGQDRVCRGRMVPDAPVSISVSTVIMNSPTISRVCPGSWNPAETASTTSISTAACLEKPLHFLGRIDRGIDQGRTVHEYRGAFDGYPIDWFS